MREVAKQLWHGIPLPRSAPLVKVAALCAAVVVAAIGAYEVFSGPAPAPAITHSDNQRSGLGTTPAITGLKVQGNRIVNGDGRTIRLLGFNHSGAEYACIEGWGIFDAPAKTRISPAVVQAMATWKGANTVRIPLNEQCWLGLGVSATYGGADYQRAIKDLVALLNRSGFVVVLDLHRTAPGTGRSMKQEQMPDRDHSVEFWRQVAATYKDNSSVIFDLFNEPAPFGALDTSQAWRCWRDGGCTLTSVNTGAAYTAAGMNELIRAIRNAGAKNIVLAGGLHWAEVLTQWLAYKPDDPLHNVAASFHAYSRNSYCYSPICYDRDLAQVTTQVPLFVGEVGSDQVNDACKLSSVGNTGFSKSTFDWLDNHGGSYTAWTWNKQNDCLSLVADYRGTPTPIWGKAVKSRLAKNA